MIKNKPLVSVIIPTYNRVEYLKITIESIVNQTYPNIEIIVIDDGTPNSLNKGLCSEYTNVNYIKIINNGGPAKPRNKGISMAKGKYLAFVDDDDIWFLDKIEKQVKILEENPNFGLVHSYCKTINEKGKILKEIIGKPKNKNSKHGDVSMKMIGNWTVMMPTSFLRKEIVDQVGLFNEKMKAAGEDNEFWSRCSFVTKFYFINEPLAYYRIHKTNISQNKKNYIEQPLFLKRVLNQQFFKNIINKKQYKLLVKNIIRLQIKKVRYGFIKTIINLFLIDLFWIFKSPNVKMIIYILYLKKKK